MSDYLDALRYVATGLHGGKMSLAAQYKEEMSRLEALQKQARQNIQAGWHTAGSIAQAQYQKELKADYIGPKKEGSFMNEMFRDLRNFIKEHRGVFYTVALVAVADHFLLDGQFREKLKGIIAKLLSKAENALELKHEQKTN